MNFSGKKALSVFKYSNCLPLWKKLKKPDRRTDRQIDRQQTKNGDFIGSSVGRSSKKSNLEQSATLFEREK